MNRQAKEAIYDRAQAMRLTLNGKPAVLRGRLGDFPYVSVLNGFDAAPYCWDAIERIIAKGGNFRA